MKRILTLLGIFFALEANAQKIVSDKTDEFNGMRTIETSTIFLQGKVLSPVMTYVFAVKHMDPKDTALFLYFGVRSQQVCSTDEKSKILLKTAAGDIITLHHIGDYEIHGTGDLILYAAPIESDSMMALSSPIKLIRFETSEANINVEVQEKKQTTIADLFKVISTYKL